MRKLNPVIQHAQSQHGRQAQGANGNAALIPNAAGGPRRKRRFMPRYPEMPQEMTPFAKVLVDYMWNRRPPMTTHQLAIKLGVPKQSTSNWVVRNVLPPFETIMAILARLDIPLSTLYAAYKSAGILMPRWDEQDTDSPADRANLPPTPRTRKATAVPIALDNSNSDYEPVPYTPPSPPPSEAEEWDSLIAQTAQLLRDEGMDEETIANVTAHIRARQSGGETPIQRRMIAEHTERAPSTAPVIPTTQTRGHETSPSDDPGRPSSHEPDRGQRSTKGSADK